MKTLITNYEVTKQGNLTQDGLEKNYSLIASTYKDGLKFKMYEHKKLGEERIIVVCEELKFYVFTCEDIHYTVDNLNDEYYLYSMAD